MVKRPVCATLEITADLLTSLARLGHILNEQPAPDKDRLMWDGEKFVSDNPALAEKANGHG